MLWGQKIKVYTDHKNLERDALGLSSDRVYRWRVLLEEYGVKIEYIRGIDNSVADAISRLEYDPDKNPDRSCYLNFKVLHNGLRKRRLEDHSCFAILKLLNQLESDSGNTNTMTISHVFAQRKEDSDIYPLTVPEIAEAQRQHKEFKPFFKKGNKSARAEYELRIVEDCEVLVKDGTRLVIPPKLQLRAVSWYHHYLQHPGHTRLEETLSDTMYWKNMRSTIRKHVRNCSTCQKSKVRRQKYGKLPTKRAIVKPWEALCVDLIGPYTLLGADGSAVEFMCLTMIDPATSWFEMVELPLVDKQVDKAGELLIRETFDKSSSQVSRLVNKSWLSRYPRPQHVVYDNG